MTDDPASDLDSRLCFAVYSASLAFTRAYRPHLDRLGLTYPQYLIMMVLWTEDGLSVKEIGQRLFQDSGTVTPLLKRLELAGLVSRIRSRSDERVVHAHLTARGRALEAEAAAITTAIGCILGEDLLRAPNLLDSLRDLRRRLLAAEPR